MTERMRKVTGPRLARVWAGRDASYQQLMRLRTTELKQRFIHELDEKFAAFAREVPEKLEKLYAIEEEARAVESNLLRLYALSRRTDDFPAQTDAAIEKRKALKAARAEAVQSLTLDLPDLPQWARLSLKGMKGWKKFERTATAYDLNVHVHWNGPKKHPKRHALVTGVAVVPRRDPYGLVWRILGVPRARNVSADALTAAHEGEEGSASLDELAEMGKA